MFMTYETLPENDQLCPAKVSRRGVWRDTEDTQAPYSSSVMGCVAVTRPAPPVVTMRT